MNRSLIGLLVVAAMAVAGAAGAEETAGRTTVKVVTIVGNPHRPAVTIEVTKQKMNVPLHALKHSLDDKTMSAAAPL